MKKITGLLLTLAVILFAFSGTAMAEKQSAFVPRDGEKWDNMEGLQEATQGGGCAGYINDGDWALYEQMDFGNGAEGFMVNASSPNEGGSVELRLDSPESTVIGQCMITKTGDWDGWQDFSAAIIPVSGVHDLYLTFRGGSGYLFNIDHFYFIPAAGGSTGEEYDDEQDEYWTGSGREELWNALNTGSPQMLSDAEKSVFFAQYAADMKLADWEGGDGVSGSFSIRADGTFRAEYRSSFEGETEEYIGSGTFVNVCRLSNWVYALEPGEIRWNGDENEFLVQNQMLFEIPGAAENDPGILKYELQNIAKQNGLNPAGPVSYCFITAFDSAPLWYGQTAGAGTVPAGNSIPAETAPKPVLLLPEAADSGTWTCTSCGLQGNTGNFCANCGAARPAADWICASCGAAGNTGNFCYNCGAARPAAEWTCPNCGQTGNTGSFCPTCGTARNGTAPTPQAPALTPAPTEAPTPAPEPQPTVNPHLEQIPGETGRVKICLQGVDASKYIKAGDNPNKWVPQNAADGNETTCWQYNGGGGVWLELNIGASEAVDEIWFKNGFWAYNDKGKEQYSINARPKAITVEFLYSGEGAFRDGESFTLADTWGSDWQRFQISRREGVTAVRITVNSIYTGSYFKKDVCLSEVMLVQHAPASIAAAAQGRQAAVTYESRPEVSGCELLDRLSTRSGPGTVYQEPGTFFRNDTWRGRTVRVLKKSTGDGVWWVQVDFQTDNGNRYRVWTGKKRVDVNLDRVQQEYPIGDCDIASTSNTRWGPGGSYASANIAIVGSAMGVLYEIDNGWADVEYYSDSGHGRVWVPVECVYNVDTSTDRSGE